MWFIVICNTRPRFRGLFSHFTGVWKTWWTSALRNTMMGRDSLLTISLKEMGRDTLSGQERKDVKTKTSPCFFSFYFFSITDKLPQEQHKKWSGHMEIIGEERKGKKKRKESRANYDRKGGREKLPCLWFWFPEQRPQQFIIFLQAGPVWFNSRIKHVVINE